ncbi:MAG: hypothetical protein ACOCU6_02115 [Nanoarchaeota archaeon]
MKRKIIRLAEKTLVVSLPASWLSDQALSKGDELECLIQGNRLVFIPEKPLSDASKISLDIAKMSERVLRWQISSFHKQGYDEIEITSYTSEQYVVIEELVTDLFVGFIIKERSKLRILIGKVAVVDAGEFDATLRRAFRLLISSANEALQSFKVGDGESLSFQLQHEKNNNKLTNFCERLLNKSLHQKEKGHFWYVIAWNLEKIADNFKYLANYYSLNLPVFEQDVLGLFEDVISYMDLYYDLFYAFSFEKLVRASRQKHDLEKRLLEHINKVRKDEIVLLHYLHMIVLQMADFSASTIALRHEKA